MLTSILAALLSRNYTFVGHIGITGAVKSKNNSIADNAVLGGFVTLMLLVCTAVCWALNSFVLASASFLAVFVDAVIVVALLVLCKLALARTKLAGHIDFIAATLSVLILCVSAAGSDGIVSAIVTALFTGIGYTVFSIVFASLCEKLDGKAVPAPFRGLPIELLTAGMIALALICF